MTIQGRSIRQLLVILTLFSTLPAMAIIIWTGIEHGRVLEQSVREQTEREVEMLAQLQQTISESIVQTLNTLAVLPGIRSGTTAARTEILQTILDNNPSYVNLALTDSDGIVQASSRLEIGTDLSERRHVRRALRTGEPAAGEFVLAFVGDVPSFPYAVAVYDEDGGIDGALTAVYRLEEYAAALAAMRLPRDTLLLILDHSGTRLFSSQPELTIGDAAIEQLQTAAVDSDAAKCTLSDAEGRTRFFAFQRIRLSDGQAPYLHIALGIPEQRARQPALSAIARNLILMLAAGVLSLLIAMRTNDRLIGGGLRELEQSVASIEQGRLATRSGITRAPREIRRVSQGLDSMAVALQQRSHERDATEKALQKTLIENQTLLREVHHRVKNNLQLILSMVHLEKSSQKDFDTFSAQLESRIAAMAGVHELLYQSEALAWIEIHSFLQLLSDLSSDFCSELQIDLRAPEMHIPLEQAIPLALITNEFLTNAAKYARSRDGSIHVQLSFHVENGFAELRSADSGPGIPADYHEAARPTLGRLLLSLLAEQLDGSISAYNRNGAVFVLRYPFPAPPHNSA